MIFYGIHQYWASMGWVGGHGVRWVVGKVKTRKQNQNTQMVGFAVVMMFHLYPQWANIPLQDLDRRVLIAGALQYKVPTAKLELSTGTISPVVILHDQQKSRPVDISQWRW